MVKEDDLDDFKLSADTLAALREFQADKEAEEARFASLANAAQERFSTIDSSSTPEGPGIDAFKEDWQLSQFWYSDDTAEALASELLSDAGPALRIAILCAPSVYPKLLAQGAQDVWLFEYDARFEVLAGSKFVKYDYNYPTRIPVDLKGTFDRIIVDPPFLSDDCETKAAMTARYIAKSTARIILCSGAKMRDLCMKLYRARETRFKVQHKNGRLSNDFMCLANYESQNSLFRSI